MEYSKQEPFGGYSVCRFFNGHLGFRKDDTRGGCRHGSDCDFLHVESTDILRGTQYKRCRYFNTDLGCSKHNDCTFAHVAEDIQRRFYPPASSRDIENYRHATQNESTQQPRCVLPVKQKTTSVGAGAGAGAGRSPGNTINTKKTQIPPTSHSDRKQPQPLQAISTRNKAVDSKLNRPASVLKSMQKPTKVEEVNEEFLNFPFLVDRSTVEKLKAKKYRIMFVMRGASGSGKTIIAKRIETTFKPPLNVVVCCADSYFMDEGTYNFHPKRLPEVHERCKELASNSCRQNVDIIIVDNTNVLKKEIAYYLEKARQYDYVVIEVEPSTLWCRQAPILAKKSVHNVPQETIQKRLLAFEEVEPIYWGWFLSVDDSRTLSERTTRIVSECRKRIPGLTAPNIVPLGKRLHCTAFYVGSSHFATPYGKSALVKQAKGKVFCLKVVGFCITPKTISARVEFGSDEQRKLWREGGEQLGTLVTIFYRHIKQESTDCHHNFKEYH